MMRDVAFAVQGIQFLTDTVFELVLKADDALPVCQAGQFLHLKIPNQNAMLRRPFCIYKVSKACVTLLVAVVGKGTQMLAQLKKDDVVHAILPIGNGFAVQPDTKTIALIGGGVGCAPLYLTAKNYPKLSIRAFLGFNTDSGLARYLNKDYTEVCKTVVASEDGSVGEKGFVTDAFVRAYQDGFRPDVIFTCGAEPMMRAVKKLAAEYGIAAYGSGEVRMGCGVGACLVCTCAVKGKDGAMHHKRACVDGPVFGLEDWAL